MLVVKHIPEDDETGTTRSARLEIPAGMWAVFVNNVHTDFDTDWKNQFGRYPEDYSIYSECTGTFVIDGPDSWLRSDVKSVVVSREVWGPSELDPDGIKGMTERLLFYSDHPFVVRTHSDDVYMHSWAHMATRVGPGGLTRQLPEMKEPEFVASPAVPANNWQEIRPGKWCSLSALADLVGWDARSVLLNHANDVDSERDMHDDVHVALADSADEMAQLEHFQMDRLDVSWLDSTDLRKVWVRKHFALVVLYLHHIGWTASMIKSTRRDANRKTNDDGTPLCKHGNPHYCGLCLGETDGQQSHVPLT